MVRKPTYEELEQRVKELEKEIKKREDATMRKETTLHRKAEEFIAKYSSTIKKIPPKDIQFLVEDLQIHKTELEMQNEELQCTQLKLIDARNKYSDLYDNAPVGYFSIDNEGKILNVNKSGAAMLGMEQRSLTDRPFSDFIARDDQDIFDLHRQALAETKSKQTCELRLVKKNGSHFFAHLDCIVILDKEGALSQIRMAINDINDRKKAEQALQESEEKLRTITDTAVDSIFCKDINRRYTFVNPSMIQLLDCTKADLIGKTPEEVFGKEDAAIVNEVDERTLNGENVSEVRSLSIAGKQYTFHTVQVPLHDSDGKIVGISGIVRNTTDFEQALEALRESEEKYSKLFHSNPQWLHISTLEDGRYDEVNEAVKGITGYEPDELIGRTSKELGLWADYEERTRLVKVAKEQGGFREQEATLLKKNGEHVSVLWSAATIEIMGTVYFINSVADISERKRAEEERELTLSQFRATLEATVDGIIVVGLDSETKVFSKRFKKIWHMPDSVLDSEDANQVFDYVLDQINEPEVFSQKVQAVFADPNSNTFDTLHLKDGRILEVYSRPQKLEDKLIGRVWAFRDVTKTKQAIMERQKAQSRLQALSDASFEAIFFSDQGVCIDQNSAAERMFGYSHKEAIGRNGAEWIVPEDREEVENNMLAGYEKPYEVTGLRKDGSTFPAEIQGHMLNFLGKPTRVTALRDNSVQQQTREALRESENKYRTLIETIPHGIQEMDTSGIITFGNSGYHRMLGYDQGELEGRSAFDLIPDDSTRKELQDYVEILVKEQPSRTPWFGKSKKKDGNIIDVQTDWNYKRDKEGRVTGFISIVTDISERVQAEKNIKRQARLLDLIFEHSLDSIVLLDKDYNFIRVSETYAKACQRESSEFPGHNHFEFYPSDLKDEVDEAKKGKCIYKKTARPFVFPDHPEWGTTYWNLGLVPILDKEGEIELFLFTLKDVTEQVQAEEALRGSEAKYRTLFEDSPISLWEEDFSAVKSFIDNLRDKGINDFRTYFEEHPEDLAHCAAMVKIVDINKATIDMYQVETKKEFLKGLSQFFTEETYELFKEEILSLCAGNTSFENKAINQATTGEIKYIYMKCSLARGQEETWSKMLVSIVDITDLKQAEEALRKSEAHLSALIQMLPDLVWLKDADGVYLSCNRRVECLFGAKEDEIVGKTDYDFVDKELADFLRENDRAAVAAGTVSVNEEEIAFADDGHVEILETLKTPMYDSEGNLIGVIGISRDITGRKQTEEVLRKSEERFRTVADFTYDWEYWVAQDGRYLYVSPSCERITGYRSEEFVNDPGLLEKIVHPDDHSDIVDHVQGEEGLEKLHSVDFRIITRSGEERWINHVCQVVYGTNGAYLGRRGSNRDISKQKLLQEELLKAKKLESVGVLAGGIAHDFNNLMSVIVGNISLARTEMRPGSKGFKNLVEAEKASIQTTALTSRLITFSKGGGPVKEPVSIGDLVKNSVNSSLKGSDISCIFSVPEYILPVEVDEEQMKQVIHNITTNAQEAMAEQGTINVSCGNVIIGEKDALTLKDGKYVKISIEDQGPGIPEEDFISIFDPYFSTKDMGTQKGMGLGLAVSDSIVKKHDGVITVESKLGTGTTFSIYLPASEKEIVEATPVKKPIPEISESKGEKILVMDDEEVVRDVSNALLAHLGYEVEVAVDGVEAIELYKKAIESEKPFDMVILDLTNKIGMGGAEAMVNLLEIDPDIKAIVASGYSNDPIMSNFREHGFRGALPKPFNLDKLKEALHDAITGE